MNLGISKTYKTTTIGCDSIFNVKNTMLFYWQWEHKFYKIDKKWVWKILLLNKLS